jgi:hypothetical protein
VCRYDYCKDALVPYLKKLGFNPAKVRCFTCITIFTTLCEEKNYLRSIKLYVSGPGFHALLRAVRRWAQGTSWGRRPLVHVRIPTFSLLTAFLLGAGYTDCINLMRFGIRILLVTLMRIRILASKKSLTLKNCSNRLIYSIHFDADPDPAYPFDADPDPANNFDPDPNFRFDADPD